MPVKNTNEWLPISKEEITKRGWETVDVIIVSGDAYVDHPSFGHAMIGRLIEKEGYRVAILPQPNWRDDLRDFKKLGTPRLFFGVTSGCMDSMVNHYTAFKRLRSTDAYTPGNVSGFRPDYACVVYSKILKKLFPETPVVLGGVEASLRRFVHYDYWTDKLKPSILVESSADLLVYGQGILPVVELLKYFNNQTITEKLHEILQIAYISKKDIEEDANTIFLPSYEECLRDKNKFAESYRIIEIESNKLYPRRIVQKHGNEYVVVNVPHPPMNETQIDKAYDLPYTRMPHPRYQKRGSIPAYEMIRHSINTHTGCFGGCSFCSISMHQGKFVSSRSVNSIRKEALQVTSMPDFKGHITDLGGPTANMYKMKGKNITLCESCQKYSCIYPKICKNLDDNHKPLIELYKTIRSLPGVKKLSIGSGLRYDLFIDRNPEDDKKNHCSEYFFQLVKYHVSGRLKVAPEHTSDKVLRVMRKPSFLLYKKFQQQFNVISAKSGLKQQIVPYFISSHPGCSMSDMAACAIENMHLGIKAEQVQDFTPTPMTLASVMYYTGIDPYTGEKIYVAKNLEEKKAQKMMFFWYMKENKHQIIEILKKHRLNHYISKLFKI